MDSSQRSSQHRCRVSTDCSAGGEGLQEPGIFTVADGVLLPSLGIQMKQPLSLCLGDLWGGAGVRFEGWFLEVEASVALKCGIRSSEERGPVIGRAVD